MLVQAARDRAPRPFFLKVMSSTRRPTVASRTLAEQLRPVVDVHRTLQRRDYTSIDIDRARTRIATGRIGFDVATLLDDAGDLTSAFARTAAAFELAGIASAQRVAALDRLPFDATAIVLGWANADSLPVDALLQFARRIGAIVGNAILSRAAMDVMNGAPPINWKRSQCPCCGASPDVALTTDARRMLVCWRCDAMWRTEDRGCLGCGAESPPTLVRIPSPYLSYELAICNACGRYLKERRGGLNHELLVERELTAGLDEAAQQRGLRT